ncbi:MAG: methyltransferase domain-containing protein [Pseudonocardiaceae bacterium]
MTVTVPEPMWRELARQLADDINAVGKLHTPEWRAAVEDVPRHVFVPRYYTDDQDGRSRRWTLHEPADPGSVARWLELVYSPTTLVTQVADLADRGTQAAVSSSTKPDLMIRMLEALDITDGMRVLEIGTGTGYNAALLTHRLGAEQVYSVDVDPHLVDDARDRLALLGYTPTLAVVDGIEGLPEHAPYDRIIATCALFAVPTAWITQLRPDGLALVHIEGPLGAGNLLALRHVGPDTVQGRFLPWWGCFMRRRATAGPTVGAPRPARTGAAPTTRTTSVDPTQLDGGARFPFLAQLHLPPGVFRSMWRGDDGETITELRAPDGSWSEVIREPDPDGQYQVREAGSTPLWAQIEAAWEQWTDLDAPDWHEFGLTATPTTHRVWFGKPDGPAWPLPTPADP